MAGYTFITDIPAEITLDDATDTPTKSEHPIAVLGSYKDPRYGKFAVTEKDYRSWVKNMADLQDGRIPIDYDHAPEKGAGSKAAGWITALKLAGEKVVATIEWTVEGVQAVKDRYWLYVSPSFTDHYTDEQDRDRGPALLGVALTNRPFLRRGMPAISLSQDGFAEHDLDARRDSRNEMAAENETPEGKEAELVTETKTLDQMAKEEGKILLDSGQYEDLQARIKVGEDAAKQLHEQTFVAAYDKALEEGRVDAKEETKSNLRELYDANPAVTLDVIAGLGKVVTLDSAKGDGGESADVPEGVDADRFELDRKAKSYAAEHNVDYVVALSKVA